MSAPPSSIAADNFEVVGLAWMTPQEALRQMERKEISMIWPQLQIINELATMKFKEVLDYVELRTERDPKKLEMVIPGPPPGAAGKAGGKGGKAKAKM